MIDIIEKFDMQLFLFLNNLHSPASDAFWLFVTGKYFWILFYIPVLIFVIKKYRWRTFEIFFVGLLIITLTDQVANLLKSGIMRPRPCRVDEILDQIHLLKGCSEFGFVSGHAANAFGQIGFILSLDLFKDTKPKKLITASIILWAVLVALSRIFVGVHYPLDIVGGALTGVFISVAIVRLRKLILQKYHITN